MCGIYGTTLKYSESDVHLTLVAVSVMGILVVTHNYFANEILIFISILLLVRLGDKSNTIGVADDAEDVSILRSL
ncbi:MAG: hypothetical protein V7719_18410 [Psychroserpens sp.]|uniref:hypothetical protein n=1 Tax=Psychroserpens sp. TaxID=2020870 RepID=UPI0030036DEE